MTNIGSPSKDEDPTNQPSPEPEPVWTYRGYRLRSSEFTTAMAHFFRAEVQRANIWRTRLDATTNWAVVSTGAALTIAFTQSSHHGVILLNTLLITLFLYIEARRYRYYELWSSRIRLMETDFYAAMLVPPFRPRRTGRKAWLRIFYNRTSPSRCGRRSAGGCAATISGFISFCRSPGRQKRCFIPFRSLPGLHF